MTDVAGAADLSLPVFTILRALIHDRTGLHYADDKRGLLADKLADRVRKTAGGSFLDYYYRLKYEPDAADEWGHLRDAVAIPETYFWREADHLRTLADRLIPELLSQQGLSCLRIWSAACASGEEPLSIAMALDDAGWFARTSIAIQASDASSAAIAKARRGIYRERSLRNLPARLRDRYFSRVEGGWRVAPELQSRVEWSVANLIEAGEIERLARASIVFCRNVFIYFSPSSIQRVLEIMARSMPPGAFLLLGAAESIHQLTGDFELREVEGSFVYVNQRAQLTSGGA